METIKNHILLFIGLSLFSSCNQFEVRGFFASYENANERFEQSEVWNNQNGSVEINVNESNYSINVMGDSHIGNTDNLDIFFSNSISENVSAAIIDGDITTGHKEDYDILKEHLPSKDDLNYFAVAGNHDLYFDGWKQFYSIFGSSSYIFFVKTSDATDLYICLDTAGGTLGNLQLEWFEKLLKTKRSQYRHCVMITHNNILRFRPTASTNPNVEEVQLLLDLFVRYDVSMVITAHDHVRGTDKLGNTQHIIMDALQDSNKNATYLKLSVNKDILDYEFIDVE